MAFAYIYHKGAFKELADADYCAKDGSFVGRANIYSYALTPTPPYAEWFPWFAEVSGGVGTGAITFLSASDAATAVYDGLTAAKFDVTWNVTGTAPGCELELWIYVGSIEAGAGHKLAGALPFSSASYTDTFGSSEVNVTPTGRSQYAYEYQLRIVDTSTGAPLEKYSAGFVYTMDPE